MDTPASPPIETVEISKLYCSPTNPRRNDEAVPHVASSIRRFGWQQPTIAMTVPCSRVGKHGGMQYNRATLR